MGRVAVQITQRAQALAFLEAGVPIDLIVQHTRLAKSTVYLVQIRALERGYHPETNPVFQDHFFEDAQRPGHPQALGEEQLGRKDVNIHENIINVGTGALEAFVIHDAATVSQYQQC